MRKLILRWLLGGDAKDWEEMFKVVIECHENCKTLLKDNELLFSRYKALSEENIKILGAIGKYGSPVLMLNIIGLLQDINEKWNEEAASSVPGKDENNT